MKRSSNYSRKIEIFPFRDIKIPPENSSSLNFCNLYFFSKRERERESKKKIFDPEIFILRIHQINFEERNTRIDSPYPRIRIQRCSSTDRAFARFSFLP